MFDCGMHMGYNDERRFPDFSYISKTKQFTKVIDCVIITHFHLDHCGALPYFTEMCGYDGPIYMTLPTKAICPILLEDYRKIMVERKGESNFFTPQMIKDCMKKVIPVGLHQTVKVDEELSIKAYYAGHVLGAAMFYAKVGDESVVYTGDYNMTPDRHLGSAWIDQIKPDLLITETTYATTIRDSKRGRERDFLKRVHECVEKGGKVLIPVFALGRVQELCILIDSYWEQMNLSVPIYFSAGLAEKANFYYKLFINWTNQKIKQTFVQRNMFDFKHIKPFQSHLVDAPGPMVLFATPGMLHAGASLEVFKKWAPSELNMVIIPGYCVVGTVGNKLLSNTSGPQMVEIDKKTTLEVKCKVHNLSFSAHADAKGIMQLIKMSSPKNVLLVHGEREKMGFLSQKIIKDFSIPCYYPANGTTVNFNTQKPIPIDISTKLLKRQLVEYSESQEQKLLKQSQNLISEGQETEEELFNFNQSKKLNSPVVSIPMQGIMIQRENHHLKLLDFDEASKELLLKEINLDYNLNLEIINNTVNNNNLSIEYLQKELQKQLPIGFMITRNSQDQTILSIKSIQIQLNTANNILKLQWSHKDDNLSKILIQCLKSLSIVDVK
ncbi:integrator complex subunit 11 [Tieghemostelium lacteum]|uniref:Integrator complex subunit 11 n=1 Tax=Tieghemostelium lacteum TaxID=361077 RepID=A0A151ZK20_TIELA|nr:integrator complex subunit 11 [Tieghemostelium lacteum]|eukprot:KYQ94230.1 integrator complex subunit 11 [Tieghemostelium lacteum]